MIHKFITVFSNIYYFFFFIDILFFLDLFLINLVFNFLLIRIHRSVILNLLFPLIFYFLDIKF
jgi:hypothetical protein